MMETAAFAYAALASFVLQSAVRNRRHERPHGPGILLAGQIVMSASFVLAILLFGWVALQLTGYLPEPNGI